MKLAKKLILSLLALPISSFVIFLIYVFMCLFLGEDVYLIEIGTLQDFSKNSEIEEAKNEKIKSIPIIKNVVQDFKILERKVLKIKKEAEKK